MHSETHTFADLLELHKVLILVLMEDALGEGMKVIILLEIFCLNPCFNGRCTRRQKTKNHKPLN